MRDFEEKVLVFFRMFHTPYRIFSQRAENGDEEECTLPEPQLTLTNGSNFTDDLMAMLVSMKLFCDAICPQIAKNEDLVGFTHILNRIAIQYCFDDSKDEVEVEVGVKD